MVGRALSIILLAMVLILASCSLLSDDSGVDVPAGATDIVCLVTDTKGLGDRTFNDTA